MESTCNIEDKWSQINTDLGDDIEPYIHQYGFSTIGECLRRLENAQLGQDRKEWAHQWAVSLCDGNPQASQYNLDRNLCLKFLFRIIDKNLLSAFRSFRVERIVRTCLVMDRANALCGKTNTRGLYWFADADRLWMEHLLEDPSEVKRLRMLDAPLDRRLRSLLDIEELGYRDDREIRDWMKPAKAN